MQEGWNNNMASHFEPSRVSVLYESIQDWINRYACPGWMLVPYKPHPFGKEYHKIMCAKSNVIYNVKFAKGKDQPRVLSKKEFEEKESTTGLMVNMAKPL